MTAPKFAVNVNYVRHYSNPNRFNGQPVYMSVSHVAGAIEKEGLTWWAAGEVATEAVDHPQHWQDKPRDEAWKYLRGIPNGRKTSAGDRGTDIHTLHENFLAGKGLPEGASQMPLVRGLMKYIDEVKPQPVLMESSVYSDQHLIAGSFDFRGKLGALPEAGDSLLDVKTSKGLHNDYAIQLAGYGLVANYRLDDDGKEHEWKPPRSYFLIHIKPDDYEVHPVWVGEEDRQAFLACAEIRRWQKRKPIAPALELGLPHETPWNLEYVLERVALLTYEQQLELSTLFTEAAIPLTLGLCTHQQLEAAANLVRLYEERETDNAKLLR